MYRMPFRSFGRFVVFAHMWRPCWVRLPHAEVIGTLYRHPLSLSGDTCWGDKGANQALALEALFAGWFPVCLGWWEGLDFGCSASRSSGARSERGPGRRGQLCVALQLSTLAW